MSSLDQPGPGEPLTPFGPPTGPPPAAGGTWGAPAGPVPVRVPPPPSPPPRRGPPTPLWVALGAGAFVVLLVCSIGGFFTLRTAVNVMRAPALEAPPNAASDHYAPTVSPTLPPGFLDEPPPTEADADAGLGESVSSGSFTFLVAERPTCTREPLGPDRVESGPGQFCIVALRVTNRGAAGAGWSPLDSLAYSAERPNDSLRVSVEGTAALTPAAVPLITISAGSSWTGRLAFSTTVGEALRFVVLRGAPGSTDGVTIRVV